jgi:hypothetical protein
VNVVFLSPHFPPNWYQFVVGLRRAGANVLGIGDAPYEELRPELRDALAEYYRVGDMANYDELVRAMGWFTHRHGRLDRLDSLNEYWLETEAALRTDFNIDGIRLDSIAPIKRKSLMKERFERAGLLPARGRVCRTASELRAFIEVEDGAIVGHGYLGQGHIGATTVRVGPAAIQFPVVHLPDIQLDPSDDDSDDDLPRNSPPATPDGEPKPNAQRNFTDPQSRIMFRDGTFLQAYNAQIAVDEANQIIVAAALSNQGPDTEYFEPMLRRVVENCDAVPNRITADAGYFSPANVHFAESLGTEPFVAVGGHCRDGLPDEESLPISARSESARAMKALLNSDDGHTAYARRKATVEPVFGQIRACRGFRQMSFRGLLKNRCEWLLVCATHNLLKLWRASRARLSLAAA